MQRSNAFHHSIQSHQSITLYCLQAGPFRLVEMINIIIVFFISGLTLNTDEMQKAKKYWKPVLYGLISILGTTTWRW